MPKSKILVIDDETNILNLVASYLEKAGYEYLTAKDGKEGLQLVEKFSPDIVVLDIMLPGIDGIEVLNQIRKFSNAYVILLSAKSEEVDKIVGLSVGADDYLTKPFSPRELMARIKAALRRIQTGSSTLDNGIFKTDHWKIDVNSRQIWVENEITDFTNTEFELLSVLIKNKGMVLSREQLLEQILGGNYFGEIRVVDVHLGHVRQKLGPYHGIITVRGVGYRFDGEDISR